MEYLLSSLKQTTIRFVFNYRLIFAYLMALSYICMHCFVSNSQLIHNKGDNSNANNLILRHKVNNSDSNFLKNKPTLKRSLFKRNFLIYSSSWTSAAASSILLKKLLTKTSPMTVDIKIDGPQRISPSTFYTNLKNKNAIYYSQILQDKILMHLLDSPELRQRNASLDGFFVEAGAFDGETWSNTLHLERFRNWTGILIEPSDENYKNLLDKNRNSFSIHSCLCPSGKKSTNSTYIEAGPFGITSFSSSSSSSSSFKPTETSKSIYRITCHPLAKLLDVFYQQNAQYKLKTSKISDPSEFGKQVVIDYLSLDIEGSEKNTIETFPWDRYKFNLINIEFNQNKLLYDWIKQFLGKFGYVETLVDDVWYQDVYLAHESVASRLNRDITSVSKFIKVYNL
jgi:hypothetical protein